MYTIKNREAFSLVELIMVIVLLSIGLVTLLLLIRSATTSNAEAHNITIAIQLAEGKVEEILSDRRTQGFRYIRNSNYPDENYQGYTIDTDITRVQLGDLNGSSGASDYRRVEVIVERDGTGVPVKIVTLVSDY